MMLTNKQIEQAINTQEIEITVSFGLDNGDPILYESEQNILSTGLKKNLYSDRLKLTIGPIIKILNKKAINPKCRYAANDRCHDLRKSDNFYILSPGESITILTNERIKLNGNYACLIIPRVSLSDVGIVVTTAYVDPYYNGIMRLHLTNLSDKSYKLSFLEVIAQCFFFELSDSVSETFREQFATKSVFYGQTWYGILNSNRNPFPVKKEAISHEKLSNLKYQLNMLWSFIKKHSLIFVLIANLAIIISSFTVFKQSITKYTMVVDQIESSLHPVGIEIVINSGETYGEKEITVPYQKSDIISVLCNNNEIDYKIMSGSIENESKIIFSLSLPSAPVEKYETDFTYVIIRRID